MTKRYFAIFALFVTLMLSLQISAYADSIWIPDNFFEANYDKCVHMGRSFYANGERGYVSAKSRPGARANAGTIINGDVYYVTVTYWHNGENWGVIFLDNRPGQERTGWVPMDQLVLAYDHISFGEDHSQELYDYTGDLDALLNVEELVFWTWPGSGKISMIHDNPVERGRDPARSWLAPTQAYRDSEGREWGKIGYFFAARSMWVCLSDPGNSEIPAFNPAPMPELYPPAKPSELPAGGNGLVLIIILVAVVAIGSAVLIMVFMKRKKQENS